MYISQAKNYCIVILAVLAIALTSQLWFENFSSRNFFYNYFTSIIADPNPKEEFSFTRPYRLISNLGGNQFNIRYNALDEAPIKLACDPIIEEILKNGALLGEGDIDYAELLREPGYLYDYHFRMPASVFASAFGQKNSVIRFKAFNRIVLIPGAEKTSVYFWDDSEGMAYQYESSQSITPPVPDTAALLYESAAISGYRFVSPYAFVASFMSEQYNYPAIRITNPYGENDLFRGVIEKKVDSFFTNPSVKTSSLGSDNVYTFADESTVVKYYKNDVLDYTNYRSHFVNASFLQNYSAALSFIRADQLVTNEFYMAGYVEQGTKTTFYFDYAINDLPLLMDDYKGDRSAALGHAIEITVEEEYVTHYRKLAYNFQTDQSSKAASLDFGQFMATVGESDSSLADPFTDVVLGYRINQNKQAQLYWMLRMGDSTMSIEATKRR